MAAGAPDSLFQSVGGALASWCGVLGRIGPVTGFPLPVDEVDHDQTVINDYAGQGDEPEERHGGDVDPHHQVPPERPDETERNRSHDNERLHVGTQRDRKQGEDQDHAPDETRSQGRHRLLLCRLGSPEAVEDVRKACQYFREDSFLQIGDNGRRRRDLRVDRRGHVHRAVSIDPPDRREASSRLRPRNQAERHFPAVRGPDAQVLQVSDGSPLMAGIAHHDAYVLPPALDPLHLLAVERLTDLVAQVLQRKPEDLRRRADVQPHLFLAGTE